MPKKNFRLTPRLIFKILRELRTVASEINDSMSEDSAGGTQITTDEAFALACTLADAVMRVVVAELEPVAAVVDGGKWATSPA